MPFDSRYHKWISGSSFPKSESRRVNTIILPRSADSRSSARPPSSSSVSEGDRLNGHLSRCAASRPQIRGYIVVLHRVGACRRSTSGPGSSFLVCSKLKFIDVPVVRRSYLRPRRGHSLTRSLSLALPLTFPLSLLFSLCTTSASPSFLADNARNIVRPPNINLTRVSRTDVKDKYRGGLLGVDLTLFSPFVAGALRVKLKYSREKEDMREDE